MQTPNAHLEKISISTLFPTHHLHILRLKPEDSLQRIFEALCQHTLPLVLILPEKGELFHQQEHFASLLQFMQEQEYLPLLHLVIPSQCTMEQTFATHYGMQHSSSLEEVNLKIGQATLDHATRNLYQHPNPPDSKSSRFPLGSCIKKKKSHRRLILFFVTLLIVTVLIALPLFIIPTSQHSLATTKPVIGTFAFLNSGRGYNDILTLHVNLPSPQAGMTYSAWLMPDQTDDSTTPLLLGQLQAGQRTLTYTSANRTNLLATYSGVRITEQPKTRARSTPSLDPSTWKWEGWIPNTATTNDSNSFLAHLRHLIALDPTLETNNIPGGLVIWLNQNIAAIEVLASQSQGQWNGARTSAAEITLIQNDIVKILEYLDGQFYYRYDIPAQFPWQIDPIAGKIGLINSIADQNPPAYLEHVENHLRGLAQVSYHTKEQQQLAIRIDNVIHQMMTDIQQVHNDAKTLLLFSPIQLKQSALPLLNEISHLTFEAKYGWLDTHTGETIGGAQWISSRLQLLATASLSPSSCC